MFKLTHRLQEANPDNSGGNNGGNDAWKTAFGAEAAPALKEYTDPAAFLKTFNDRSTELTTLKANVGKFDWRKEVAGEDPEIGKLAARYTDPKAFGKALVEANQKIRAGEVAKPLAANATPEQVSEWRKANGIPEKTDGYFEKLPEGLVIGKDDAPMFNAFAKEALGANYSTAQMHAAVKWYYGVQEQQAAAERDVDKADRLKTITALRTEWGDDYQPNLNVYNSWLDGMPKELKSKFKDALLGDGTRLENNVDVMKWLVSQARTINPAAGLIPGNGEGDMASIKSEKEKIEEVMRKDRKKYNGDTAMQARYLKLIEAEQKLAGKK